MSSQFLLLSALYTPAFLKAASPKSLIQALTLWRKGWLEEGGEEGDHLPTQLQVIVCSDSLTNNLWSEQ